jgi:hypothetical protein
VRSSRSGSPCASATLPCQKPSSISGAEPTRRPPSDRPRTRTVQGRPSTSISTQASDVSGTDAPWDSDSALAGVGLGGALPPGPRPRAGLPPFPLFPPWARSRAEGSPLAPGCGDRGAPAGSGRSDESGGSGGSDASGASGASESVPRSVMVEPTRLLGMYGRPHEPPRVCPVPPAQPARPTQKFYRDHGQGATGPDSVPARPDHRARPQPVAARPSTRLITCARAEFLQNRLPATRTSQQ